MHAQALGEESMSGSRKGKMQIGGHFDPRDVFTLQEVLARESRERGSRKTMQEALSAARPPWLPPPGATRKPPR
jgi:hypothetical protein